MDNKKEIKRVLKLILDGKKRGLTYEQLAAKYNAKARQPKTPKGIETFFYRHKYLLGKTQIPSPMGIKSKETKSQILKDFLNIVKTDKFVPTLSEFCTKTGTSKKSVKNHFDNISKLEQSAKDLDPESFSGIVDESQFSEEAFSALKKDVAKFRRFVITTAITGCEPHIKGLESIRTYCKINNAKLLVLPCSDPAKTKDRKYDFALSHKIPFNSVVFRDISLNSNLMLSTIKLTAKQINPLTGLRRLSNKGSCILASPKQMLQHVASSNKKEIPRAIMTTGAITTADYRTEMYMSERTAYLADADHKLGGVIVELKDSEIFFYRRFEIDPKTGEFSDINKRYLPNGKVVKVRAELVQQPDWHVLSTDPDFKKAAKQVVSAVKPKYMTLEDFFDGITINPHEKHNILSRALRTLKGAHSLAAELKACSDEINDLLTWDVENLVFKYGNHEDFLKRWLSSAEYKDDPVNHYEGVCLAKASLEGHMPFEYAMRERYPIKDQKRVRFLGINDSFKVRGIENGVHGHIGSGGKRNPGMEGLEAYGPVNAGHNHSAAILRDVVRVGTATHLQLSYNDGASSWTQTLNVQHVDGARQLITVINGEWCLKDIL